MFEKANLIKGALILIAALAILEFLWPTVMSIDTSAMPEWEAQGVGGIKHFFQVTPVAFLAGFGWSLFGYIRYKTGDAAVKYEAEKLYGTWAWFEGILMIITIGLPLPFSTAVAGIIMAAKSVFNTLRNPPSLPIEPLLAQPAPTDADLP